MLKKTLAVLVLIFTFYSCAIKTIKYSYDSKTIQQGIDFTRSQGEWLLYTSNISKKSEHKILSEFNRWTKNKTSLTSKMIDKQGKRVSSLFSTPVDSENLKFLKQVSNYKYLINIYPLKIDSSNPRITVGEVMFDIYDISAEKLILSKRVIGSMDNENTTNIGDVKGFRISATPNMVNGLIKKGLKRIHKNSKY